MATTIENHLVNNDDPLYTAAQAELAYQICRIWNTLHSIATNI